MTTDATVHLEVGDLVLVRGSPARVHMETATQVLVIFDHAEHEEEWVPKNSPALSLQTDPESVAARDAAATVRAGAAADDTDMQELSSDREDDECFVCGNGGKLTCCDVCPRVYHLRCLPAEDKTRLQANDSGDWWCPHCRRMARVTFCTFRILSESCTPGAQPSHDAAEALYKFMEDEQHEAHDGVIQEVGKALKAAMPSSSPWRHRNPADVAAALRASSFEYEAAEDAALQLQARVSPEWWEQQMDDPMEEDIARFRAAAANGSIGAASNGSLAATSNFIAAASNGNGGGASSSGAAEGGGDSEAKQRTSQYRGVSRRCAKSCVEPLTLSQRPAELLLAPTPHELSAALRTDCPADGRWKARIKQNGTDIVIGDFDNELDAALAYDAKARQIHGPRALVNFPDGYVPAS